MPPNSGVTTLIERITTESTNVKKLPDIAGTSVTLKNGLTVRFDPADSNSAGYLTVMQILHDQKAHVHVELDDKSVIRRVRVPSAGQICNILEDTDGVFLVLKGCQAAHWLDRDSPIYPTAKVVLLDAKRYGSEVIVTTDEIQKIIDVATDIAATPSLKKITHSTFCRSEGRSTRNCAPFFCAAPTVRLRHAAGCAAGV